MRGRLALRWIAEVAGVAAVAVAASLWWLPLGIGVFGVYLIIIGQMEDDAGDAGDAGRGNAGSDREDKDGGE